MAVDGVTKVSSAIRNGFAKVGSQIGSTIRHVKRATIGWLCDSKTFNAVSMQERAGGAIKSGFGKIKEATKYTAVFAKKICFNVKEGAQYFKEGVKLICDVAKSPDNYVKNLASKASGGVIADFVTQNKSKIAVVFTAIVLSIISVSILSFLLGPIISLISGLATTVAIVSLAVFIAKKVKAMQL